LLLFFITGFSYKAYQQPSEVGAVWCSLVGTSDS